jgi:SAM-dependent methyltransferase
MPEQRDTASLKGWQTVMKPNGAAANGQDYVSGNWPPEGHPLYGDERIVGSVTDWLLSRGHSVLQLYLLHQGDERRHSLDVLQRVNVPPGARVLSLGCGVAGMERYWQHARPDIRFTLVNASRAQLVRCLCHGKLVHGDMRDPTMLAALGLHDVVVMAYSLHHADSVPSMITMARCYLKPGGTLLVLDVIDTSEHFNDAVQYRGLESSDLQRAGLVRLDYGLQWHRLPDDVLGKHVAEVLDEGGATPSMWIGGA